MKAIAVDGGDGVGVSVRVLVVCDDRACIVASGGRQRHGQGRRHGSQPAQSAVWIPSCNLPIAKWLMHKLLRRRPRCIRLCASEAAPIPSGNLPGVKRLIDMPICLVPEYAGRRARRGRAGLRRDIANPEGRRSKLRRWRRIVRQPRRCSGSRVRRAIASGRPTRSRRCPDSRRDRDDPVGGGFAVRWLIDIDLHRIPLRERGCILHIA
jgi:hypothetical protein